MEHMMREPCSKCGNEYGAVEQKGPQYVVRCSCGKYQYNAPKDELGIGQRKIRKDIKPKKRWAILNRANCMCELCGNSQENLVVGHILSVKDGNDTLEIAQNEIDSEENLVSLCESCNSGMGDLSFSPRLYLRLLRIRLHRRE